MLSYALAIAVAVSSLVLFSTAFLMSKIHRRDDFFWSGVGLFYALVLWYCARNITGAVLLGQAAATALLVSFSWQTIKLRRAIADPAKAAEMNNFSVLRSFDRLLKRRKAAVEPPAAPVDKAPMPTVTEKVTIPETPAEKSEPQTKVNKDDAPTVKKPVTKIERDDATTVGKPIKESAAEAAKESVKTPATTSSIDIEFIDNLVAKQQSVSESAKTSEELPSKLPEADKIAETKTEETAPPVEKENSESVQSPKAQSPISQEDGVTRRAVENTPPATIPESSQAIAQETTPVVSVEEVKPNPKPEPKSKPEPQAAKSERPKSALDELETVEVAEILEAESNGESNDRQGDRSNIIEVTTTEINVVTETVTIDPDGEDNSERES